MARNWVDVAILFVGSAAIGILVTIATGTLRERFKPYRSILSKVAWGILVGVGIHWYATTPFVGNYYDSGEVLDYPTGLGSTVTAEYLRDHHVRIEKLELELKEHAADHKALTEHYSFAVTFAFYCLMMFGVAKLMENPGPDLENLTKLGINSDE